MALSSPLRCCQGVGLRKRIYTPSRRHVAPVSPRVQGHKLDLTLSLWEASCSGGIHCRPWLTNLRQQVADMSISTLVLGYVTVLLSGLTLLWAVTELRHRRFKPTATEDRIFRCTRCGYVYTDDPDVDRSRCSQCGETNNAVTF